MVQASKTSPGMDGERQQKMIALKERAMATMPPAFVDQPQTGPVETPEGNQQL